MLLQHLSYNILLPGKIGPAHAVGGGGEDLFELGPIATTVRITQMQITHIPCIPGQLVRTTDAFLKTSV